MLETIWIYKSSNKYPLIGGDLPAEYTLNVTFNNNVSMIQTAQTVLILNTRVVRKRV